jgi:hypothetical protein
MRILVLGGYGNFGARICRALAREAAVELQVGGRDPQRAHALAQELGANAKPVAIDAGQTDLARMLRSMGVELLIHTAGPFQQQSYAVARAAAAAGAHYIDLADGRRYVCDFAAALDAAFRAAGRTAVTGASTVPALSSAVVDALTTDWQHIDSIDICIAPAQTAPRGVATLAGVLSYCGEPIRVMDEGRWQSQRGWARPLPVQFARMRPRLGALCDIPDLELFPQRHPGVQRVMFRPALEVGAAQRALALLAALRAARLLPPLHRFAGGLHAGAQLFDRFGSGLGGMVVRVAGGDAAARLVRRAWHITADNDHGPEIPCMAAILLARRLAAGALPPQHVGAHTSVGLLNLTDFEPEFARWQMLTDTVDDSEAVHGKPRVHDAPAL